MHMHNMHGLGFYRENVIGAAMKYIVRELYLYMDHKQFQDRILALRLVCRRRHIKMTAAANQS